MKPDIVIHGLGYVGLTAAVHFARVGWNVLGYDPDQEVCDALNTGKPKAGDFLEYLGDQVQKLLALERIKATSNFSEVIYSDCYTHLVAVPTERNGVPDTTIVLGTLTQLVNRFGPPLIILIESTLVPGTVDHFMAGLSKTRRKDVSLAVCPRRDWFADPDKNLETLTRVVGGYTKACTERAVKILRHVSNDILETDYRTAEVTKSLENALLHVPVMFAHQLAWALPDHNVAEALRLAGTHWRLPSLYLGFGTGGRCVPLGTEYLVKAARNPLWIGEKALHWENQFRLVVALAIVDAGPKSVLVLGAAYRPDFKDAGRSPGLGVIKHLAHRLPVGAVTIHDPLWPAYVLTSMAGVPALSGSVERISDFDAVVLATPHTAYLDLPLTSDWRGGQVVLDAQGAWSKYREMFASRGVSYRQVGEPGWMNLRRRP